MINIDRLHSLIDSLADTPVCKDGQCDGCRIGKDLRENFYEEITSLVIRSFQTGASPLELGMQCFVSGFYLAFEYKNIERLEVMIDETGK